MNNIIQYKEGKSALHELHPNLKIILLVILTISLFLLTHLITVVIALIMLFLVSLSLGYNPISTIKQFKFLLLLFIILPIFHSTIFPGATNLRLFSINFSLEGFTFGVIVVIRLLILFIAFTLFSRTTSPKKLTQALTQNRISIIKKFGFILSFTLNLIPVILRDINRIKDSQTSRGADFDQRNLKFFTKIRNSKSLFRDYLSLLIPLLIISLTRAEKQTIAVECRGFNLENRTFLHELKIRNRDLTIFTFYLLLILVVMVTDIHIFSKLV